MKPSRKSPRAQWIEYNEGVYFVTICTKYRLHFFGEIKNEQMHLSSIGRYAADELARATERYEYVTVPHYVVMPNHIHAVVVIETPQGRRPVPTIEQRVESRARARQRSLLSVYVSLYKSMVTKYARRFDSTFAWQSRYHDHVIRDTRDGNAISEYIDNNVLRWDMDCFNTQQSQ